MFWEWFEDICKITFGDYHEACLKAETTTRDLYFTSIMILSGV